MKLTDIINKDLVCTCGRTHRCVIHAVRIGAGVLAELPGLLTAQHIVLVSDRNTDALCGDRVRALLGDRIMAHRLFDTGNELLVPDEAAVAEVEALVTDKTDFILGIGSGVINDICKYVSFGHKISCGIVATAPSMDGFASSGAAMIFEGMKITFTTHAPDLILGDTDILCTAPADMIAAGFADIIGKYSALNDWKLSQLINGEYLCPFVYDLVMEKTNEVRDLAPALMRREPAAIGTLTEILVMIGVCLTLLSTTRPGSGSEHHLSHYFEITGLILNKPYFLHGTDVGYSTVVTAEMRERIRAIKTPVFHPVAKEARLAAYDRIYKGSAKEVAELQREAGRYDKDMTGVYAEKWQDVVAILNECPTGKEIEKMLLSVGFDLSAFEKMYGKDRIHDGKFWGKDLKDRYSVLWLYFDLFGGLEA
ncbi:MAG: sn-glycerol-1-phosphate dehydrogenase [Clostridia bacterium]|nr:sn-glycerol-1-phosphate dehydrogenase [Clostridia bacterium]